MPLPTSKESSPAASTTSTVKPFQSFPGEDPRAKQPSNADLGDEGQAANQEDSPIKTEKTEEGKYEEDERDTGYKSKSKGDVEADKDIDVSGSGDDSIEQQNTKVLESSHFCFLVPEHKDIFYIKYLT